MDDEVLETNGLDIKDWARPSIGLCPYPRFKGIVASGKMGLTQQYVFKIYFCPLLVRLVLL